VSGIKFLLDTNFVIGLVKGNGQVIKILQDQAIAIEDCAYSFMTRIELLGYPAIMEPEIQGISMLLDAMHYLAMTQDIEDATINIRRQYKLKTPDAIIAATAKVMNLELLTLDQQLANRMAEILTERTI
jgi:predicted nucleic acid-binding protein